MQSIFQAPIHSALVTLLSVVLSTSAPAQSRAVAYTNAPFDRGSSSLPPGFAGIDPVGLFIALRKSPPPVKREFETTEQHNLRHEKWMKQPILGTATPSSPIALSIPIPTPQREALQLAYDADSSTMKIVIEPDGCNSQDGLTIVQSIKKGRTYAGQNSFGAKVLVQAIDVTQFCLSGVPRIETRYSYPVEVAKEEKRLTAIYIVGRLSPPFIETGERRSEPKISDPTDIRWTDFVLHFSPEELLVANVRTGAIVRRQVVRVDSGVDIDASAASPASAMQVDGNGNTSLHLAIWLSKPQRAVELIQSGQIDINRQNSFGATPLHLAVAKEMPTVVQALLAAGANRQIQDKDGSTPLQDARAKGHRVLIQLLESQ